jgi:hypothetical protein
MTAEYYLKAKCSKDAKAWFNENWVRDKDTLLLDYRNHYNKNLNKCFIFVEYHYSSDKSGASWMNNITVWDVYENSKFGEFIENHIIFGEGVNAPTTQFKNCEFFGKKCTTLSEFNQMMQTYMNN